MKPFTPAQFVICILQFVLFPSLLYAAEPTLVRLSFWASPERMAVFESAYQEKVAPVLKRHRLAASSERGRATPDSVFSRLFELETPAEVEEKQKSLQGDSTWTAVLRDLGTIFERAGPDGLMRHSWMLYAAPAGPGKTVPAGPGKTVPAGLGTEHWRVYDATVGLPGMRARSIIQDREGNLWFSSQGSGVSRYDGKTFTTFTAKDGLADNIVNSILQDREGNLWFGGAGGISRYDGKTFTTFTVKDGLAGNYVRSIVQDREGNLWFGGAGGVSRYDGKIWKTFTAKDGLAGNRVWPVFQDRDGNLWFGASEGVSRYDGKSWKTFTTKDGLAANYVWSIFQDREGALWFGSLPPGGGVSRYDGKTFTTFTVRDGLGANFVSSIVQDSAGDLWFGTQGLSRYDGKTFTTYITGQGHQSGRVAVYSLFQDQEGNLWAGTDDGVHRYDGKFFITFTVKDGLAGNRVRPVFQDRNGDLWFGTLEGVSRYDGKTFTTFTTRDGLANNQIFEIFQDREGNFWFATGIFNTGSGGVSRYDGKTFTTFTTRDGLVNNQIFEIFQDREGNIWFATGIFNTGSGGVSRYDGKTFTTFTTQDGLGNDMVNSILQDRDGNLWFGTIGGGVSRYDGNAFITFTVHDGLASNVVTKIFQDQEGDLWFGTLEGVSRYDPKAGDRKQEAWTTFTRVDGLANNTVWSLVQDRDGDFWFGTAAGGVSRYDGKVFQTLSQQDGLANNSVGSILQDREGDLWFGTVSGATRFRQPPQAPPPIFIDAVVADQRYEKASALRVPSTVKLTAFEFHGISFKTRPEAMIYRYRLKGYDKDWQNTHEHRVEYRDIPRGGYTFEVVAVDRDLTYSERPAIVALTVHLPYERYGLYAALGIALVLIVFQTARIIRRDRRLHAANTVLAVQNVELAEARVAAEEANRAKSRFLASMSHELRTPLNGILGYAQILSKDKKLNEKQRDGIGVIWHSGEHLLLLINDILDLARIEAQKVALENKEIRLPAFLKNVAALTGVRVQEKGLSFACQIPPGLPEVVVGDPRRLRQVLLNLLGNAIKFTEHGEVVLRLSVVDRTPERVRMRFEVQDTGVGIGPKDLAKIFQPFEQVGEVERHAEGTGLGLSISRQLVQVMGGDLKVESQPGAGSRFWFELDLPEVAGSAGTMVGTERLPVGFKGNHKRVLVVDDNVENRSVLIDLLVPLGFEVSEAENGQRCLDRASEWRPDVILLDLVMPVLDGFETARRIRVASHLNSVVIIALSASIFEQERQQSLDAGCNDFLPKPVQAIDLLDKMGQHLNLDWIYEPASAPVSESKNRSFVMPPTEVLLPIFELAQKGQIVAVQAAIEHMEHLGDIYRPFVAEIQKLTREFKVDEICEFIKPYLEKRDVQ